MPQSTGNQQITVGAEDDPAVIRDMFLKNPDQLALLKQNNPVLADALLSGNLGEQKNNAYKRNVRRATSVNVISCVESRDNRVRPISPMIVIGQLAHA